MSYRFKSGKLSSICEIRSGFTARGRLEPAVHGGEQAIQLRDLRGEQEIDLSSIPLFLLAGPLDRYRAGAGDVLFRSRGEPNTAAFVLPDTAGTAVVMQPLLLLRPDCNLLDPRYLTWFINQPRSQRYFDTCARGTGLRMIPKRCIEDLEVIVPDLETQRRVAQIDALARRERELMVRLAEKRQQFMSFALLRQVQEAQPHGNGAGRSGARRSKSPAGKSERTNS